MVENMFWKIALFFVGKASQCQPLPSVNFAILKIEVNPKIVSFLEVIQIYVDEFSIV